jgi:hypothetical protein
VVNPFLRLVGARRFITPAAEKCKANLTISAKNLRRGERLAMAMFGGVRSFMKNPAA